MAVKTIATMAISTAVTTCPLPAFENAPNAGMGAVGWITMMPYRTRSQRPSARFKLGAAAVFPAVVLDMFGKSPSLDLELAPL